MFDELTSVQTEIRNRLANEKNERKLVGEHEGAVDRNSTAVKTPQDKPYKTNGR